MDCSLPGSSVHGIFQAGVLEWGAIAFSISTLCLPPKELRVHSKENVQDPKSLNHMVLQSTTHCFFGVKVIEIQVFLDSMFRHTIITKLTAANVMSTYFVRKPLFRVSYLTLITRHLYYFQVAYYFTVDV